jgi:hypothetical protein
LCARARFTLQVLGWQETGQPVGFPLQSLARSVF